MSLIRPGRGDRVFISRLIPAILFYAVAGGAFLTACDALSRTIIAPVEIPVGIITALLGGPFFVWLLVKSPFGCEG